MLYYSHLPDRAVLAVSSEDAADFLQGLITKDVKKLEPGHAIFAALLSPQGRFLFDFFVFKKDGRTFWLETDKERLPELVKRLTMYRLRSKVEFEVLPMQVMALWDEIRHPEPEAKDLKEILRSAQNDAYYADPRLEALPLRFIDDNTINTEGMTQGDYDAYRLSLGIPEGSKDLIIDRSILLEYGYDEMGAVDFDKGCYVGQEVTARSKHRATLRKFIHMVEGEPLPPKGTPVMSGAREVGTMASSSGTIGLAHLRVEEAAVGNLTAEGIALTAKLPPWCKTLFQKDSA